jgi:hypothetical protein
VLLTGIAIPNLCSHWSISLGGFGNLGNYTITATRSSDTGLPDLLSCFISMIGLRWMEEAHQATVRRHRLPVALLGAAVSEAPDKRADCVLRHRLNWDVHKQNLLLEVNSCAATGWMWRLLRSFSCGSVLRCFETNCSLFVALEPTPSSPKTCFS